MNFPMFHLDWLNDGFRTGYLYIFGNSKLNSMRMLQVSRGYLSFMYLFEITIDRLSLDMVSIQRASFVVGGADRNIFCTDYRFSMYTYF